MDRQRLCLALGIFALLVGGWVAIAPFSRPLPGGAPFSFEATPKVDCLSPLIGAFRGDRPVADVYITPRPQVGDPTMEITIDCDSRAQFRFALGAGLALVGLIGLVVSQVSLSTRLR